MEGRRLAKGNTIQSNTHRTQGRDKAVSTGLDRIRCAAKRDKNLKFTALMHHVSINRLRDAFEKIKKNAAPGIDGETWATYEKKLEENLKRLYQKTQSGGYQPKPSRRVYIPKADGRLRPLGVASVEDKILQRAVTEVLNAIYEADFLGFSYGYRPKRNPHQALDALAVGIRWKKINWVLDADISGFYDNISHEWMMKFISHRIADNRMLRLINKWLKAGVMEDGKWSTSEFSTPQGASISPLLSNIYLHYAFDQWVHQWREKSAKGDVIVTRWADDFVIGLQYKGEAEQISKALSERLNKFSLSLHPDKTQLIRFGRFAKRDAKLIDGQSKPKTFNFLGMTHICGQTKDGKYRIHRKTIRKRLTEKLKTVKAELTKRMHAPIKEQGEWIKTVVRGYFNYHAIPGNMHALETFKTQITRMWYRLLRRRSQKSKLNWEKMNILVQKWIPKPKILHPWPEERLQRHLPKARA